MKKLFRYISLSAVALTAAAVLPSCSMEEPFNTDGEGLLTINTEINGDVVKTRAQVEGEELENLRKNCVIYIENGKGVIRKFKGVDNIPASIKLQTGAYVAEAWSGDSVSASFSSKFYRGYQTFNINEGQNSLTLKCNIANVLVSVDPASLDVALTNLKVTFWHSRGELVFTEQNIRTDKGYFMMPNADKDLSYKIEGTKSDGSAYLKEGTIPDVKRAHEYVMTLAQDEQEVEDGGAMIRIKIADIPLIEETFEICPGPAVRGIEFNMDEQIASTEKNFNDYYVNVKTYEGLSSVILTFSDNFKGITGGNILNGNVKGEMEALGITYEHLQSVDAAASAGDQDIKVDEVIIKFSKEFLNSLPESNTEYVITIEGVDEKHREGKSTLRIANSSEAVEVLYPVSTVPAPTDDLLAIGARKATLYGLINDPENAVDYGIKYRVQGTSEWTEAYPANSRMTRAAATQYTVELTGLQPGTTYEYISFCKDYDSNAVMKFATEKEFTLENASFEEWSEYTATVLFGSKKQVVLPGGTGDKTTSFWGSGNEGSATVNKTLTNKYDGLKRTGTYSARLASDQSAGILAAGNIFVGEYAKTDGTNGVLNLGREYNGSHPTGVRVYCNYRPGTVDILKDNNIDIKQGDKDHGQVYIALTSGPMEVRTKDKYLVTPDRSEVIAYGQVTLTDDYGDEGELKQLDVKFEYNDKAKTQRPTHIVIVATAAKFGDYFSGSSTSVMILDDFSLIYE